jgi:phage baseplate assembly protein W
MAVDFPHFTLPFQWALSDSGGLGAAVADQESIAEIGSCVEAIIRTVQGERTTLPDFGVPQLEFNANAEVAAAAVAAAVLEFEPRVEALITGGWDSDDNEVQAMRALIAPADDEQGDAQ